jgi:hypothetical protein
MTTRSFDLEWISAFAVEGRAAAAMAKPRVRVNLMVLFMVFLLFEIQCCSAGAVTSK